VPAPGISSEFVFGLTSSSAFCTRGTSAPDGRLAFGIEDTASTTFWLFPADASPPPSTITGVEPSGLELDSTFHWTTSGWAGLVRGSGPPVALRTWDGTGNALATTQDDVVASAPDGQGGTVALGRQFIVSGPGASSGPTKLEWIDASGAVTRTVTLDADPIELIVNWSTGHVLTLHPVSGGSTLRARWWDGAGAPLTPWFDAGAASVAEWLHLLVDGSVAFTDGTTWRGVFRDGVAAVDPPPAWLAARPGTRLATIRGGRGYALLPREKYLGNPDDQTKFEIVAATGESCGTVTLPDPPPDPDRTFELTALGVGQDGTLFQTEEVAQRLGGHWCGYRTWHGLLQ
jgi:hypothetical protein